MIEGDLDLEVLLNFTPRQWEATLAADEHDKVLFGGARGGGKSRWLRWFWVRYHLMWHGLGVSNIHTGLFCNTYNELVDRQVTKVKLEFPAWLGEVKESRTEGFGFHFRDKWCGGMIAFRNLDDPTKYQSNEFAGIGVDELTKTPSTTFDILRGSLRWPGIARPKFIAGTNPNGRYAQWVRDYWIEHKLPENLSGQSSQFAYIQSLPTDNPYLEESYWQELNTLAPSLRDPWLKGDWYAKAEGIVYSEFNEDNLTDAEPDLSQPIELGIDDGYIDPRVMLFIQRSGTRVLVFDEIWQTKTLEDRSVKSILAKCAALYKVEIPPEWAGMKLEECAAWCAANGVRLPEIACVGSESIQLMNWLRRANIVARGATHPVIDGVAHMRGLILDGNGRRVLQVHRRCSKLIEELTRLYVYPEGTKGNMEKPQDGNDHGADALRYWCYMRARKV